MAPRTVLITGANRGIGFGITKNLLSVEGIEIVIAACRSPKNAEELKKITNSKLHIVQLDITNDASIQKAVGEVEKIVGERGLNLLINNAGVITPYGLNSTPSRSALFEQFDINISSVIINTQYFLPLIKKAPSDRRIINISSLLGSIGSNTWGSKSNNVNPTMAYSVSKTAVNQFTKCLSIDLADDNIIAAAFCPGWVQTDLGGSHAFLTLDQSMADLVPSILKVSKEHNGGYFDRTLQPIPY